MIRLDNARRMDLPFTPALPRPCSHSWCRSASSGRPTTPHLRKRRSSVGDEEEMTRLRREASAAVRAFLDGFLTRRL